MDRLLYKLSAHLELTLVLTKNSLACGPSAPNGWTVWNSFFCSNLKHQASILDLKDRRLSTPMYWIVRHYMSAHILKHMFSI